eukprot:COSAG02_NODE_3283_length_7019_cov_7.319364_2_plen_262_part_00
MDSRVEAMCREIATRGKIDESTAVLPEGGPSTELPVPASAPKVTPSPAKTSAVAPAVAPAPRSVTEAVLPRSDSALPSSGASPELLASSPGDLVAVIGAIQTLLHAEMDRAQAQAEAQAERQRAEIARAQAQAEAQAKTQRAASTLQALTCSYRTLQARLTTLHAAQLLSDEDLFELEDVLGDYMVAKPEGGILAADHPAVARFQSLLALSEGFLTNDAAFARQVGTAAAMLSFRCAQDSIVLKCTVFGALWPQAKRRFVD